jgi:hypothetical protein
MIITSVARNPERRLSLAAKEVIATRRRPDQVLWEIEELPVLSHGTALFRI